MADPALKHPQTASSIPEPSRARASRPALRGVRAALSCCCAVLVLLGLWLGSWRTAHAQTEASLRVLILEGPGAEWLRRVRGQLSDLPVLIATLPLVVDGQAEADVVRQLRPLAERREAALVAWLVTDGARYDASASDETHVAIWFAGSGRLFTRRLGSHWRRLSRTDRSAVLEIGALSVRSAVRSLLLDPSQSNTQPEASAAAARVAQSRAAAEQAARAAERVARPTPSPSERPSDGAAPSPSERRSDGVPSPSQAPGALEAPSSGEPPADVAAPNGAEPSSVDELPAALEPDSGRIVTSPRGATDPTPPASDRGSAAAESGGIARQLHWSAELGLSGQLAGPPGYASAGIAAGVHAASGRWALGLLGRFGLPLRSELGPSEISLQQHALLAEAQYLGWSWGALALAPLVRAGLALSRRETLSGPTGLAASAVAWHRSAQLGAGALAEYRWGTHWGASLRGVLHWLPSRTDYSLLDDLGDPIASEQPWAVQPSLELSASWHW